MNLLWLNTGLRLFVIAIAIVGVVYLMATAWRRIENAYRRALPVVDAEDDNVPYEDAVLVVKRGGSIARFNQRAREWFGVDEYESLTLERVARQIRPSERFLELCIQQNEARLSVTGRVTRAVSYRLENGDMAVVLRPITSEAEQEAGERVSDAVLKAVSDFGQTIAAHEDFSQTIQAILQNFSNLVPFDAAEVKLFEEGVPIIYRLNNDLDATSVTEAKVSQFGEMYQYVLQEDHPVLVRDVRALPQEWGGLSTMRSYLGAPLKAGGQVIGIFEIGQAAASAYTQADLDILNLVLGQITMALRNAQFYRDEQRRLAEISSLARLSEASSALDDLPALHKQIITVVDDLFDVGMIGVVLYDEFERVLQAQSPFKGLSDDVVSLYRAKLDVDQARMLTDIRESVFTEKASEDWYWEQFNLQGFAQAASIKDAALVPLRASDTFLGFLHLSNHGDGSSVFSAEERRLLRVLSAEIAVMLHNALLVRRSRQRAVQAETLQKLSMFTTSSASLDEILRYATREMTQLLGADLSVIYMLDEQNSALRLQEQAVYGVDLENLDPNWRELYIDDAFYRFTVTGSKRPFFSNDLSTDERVLDIYRPLIDAFDVRSTLTVPLYVGDKHFGEWMVSSRSAGLFDEHDLRVLMTAAGQLSAALDARLYSDITDADLRQRVDSLLAVAHSSRILHVSHDRDGLLDTLYKEAKSLLRADCGNVFLVDVDENDNLSLGRVIGDVHSTAVLPIERFVYAHGESLRVANFEYSQYSPPHVGVKSALVAPIKFHGKVLGLIYLHGTEENKFTEEHQFMLDTLAYHAGVALENLQRYLEQKHRARLYQKRAVVAEVLEEAAEKLAPDVGLEAGLEYLAEYLRKITPFDKALISVYDEERSVLRRVVGIGFSPALMRELQEREQSWTSVQQFFRPTFQIGRAYFIPHDKAPVVPPDVHIVLTDEQAVPTGEDGWHPQDLLLYPLYKSDGQPLGLLSVDAPRDGRRPDQVTIEAIASLAAYAEQFITYNKTHRALSDEVERLSTALSRLELLRQASSENLPSLLHKDLEQTLAMQDLVQRGQRIRAGLHISEKVSRQINADLALQALAQELLQELNFTYALVAEQSLEGPQLLHVFGDFPENVSVEALFGQRNPLLQTLRSGDIFYAPNLDEDQDWQDASIFLSLKAKSFVSLPIQEGDGHLAAVMAIGVQPMEGFTDEDVQVFERLSGQISIIVQNLRLLADTSRNLQEVQLLLDFSQRIADLPPEGMVQVLLENALHIIQPAHAGVVFLWDESTKELRPWSVNGYADDDSMQRITYHLGEALPGRIFADGHARRLSEINFAREYDFGVEKLMLYQQATSGRLPISSLLSPIRAGERLLGLVLLDNFNETAAFSTQDEALLESLTQQMALALENYRLLQDAQERVGQLQGLYQASLGMASSLSRQALVESLLPRLKQIVPYDTAILWLRNGEMMTVAAADGFEDDEERLGLQVAIDDSALLKEMINKRRSIVVADVREDDRFPKFIENPSLSWLGVPILIGGQVQGVLALEKAESYFYKSEYVQLANNFAAQSAVALQNASLYEQSVQRATALDQRSRRLALLNEFSASLSGLLDKDRILSLALDQIYKAFDARQIFLMEFPDGQNTVWTKSVPELATELPQQLPRSSMCDELEASGGIIIRENFLDSPDSQMLNLPFVEGAPVLVALPFKVEDRLQAVAFLQVERRDAFGPNEIELVRTIVNQTTLALQNAVLYESVVQTAERLDVLNRVSAEVSASLEPETIYTTLHWAVTQLMPVDAFVISMLDEEAQEVDGVFIMEGARRVESMRVPLGEGISSQVIMTGEPLLLSSTGSPYDEKAVTIGEKGQPESILAVPITIGGKTRGMLSAQSYQKAVYSEKDVEILTTLANQAAVALNNARLFSEINKLAAELEARVIERTAELEQEKRRTEFLLRALSEVSSSLDLNHALNRTLALLNEAIGAEQSTIMMLDYSDNKLYYRAGYGYVSERYESGQTVGFGVGEGLAGWVLQNKEPVLVPDLTEDPRWLSSITSGSLHRSAIAVPMIQAGSEILGVLLVYHRVPSYFTQEHLNLAEAIASQVSVAINNARLYELIRTQAENMGMVARQQQIEASRRVAILESVADGVVVTDTDNTIDFVNSSALQILGLQRDDVLGRSIDDLAGLFGESSAAWLQTIREWSLDPYAYEDSGAYAEQIELDDGRIIMVHLAPVLLQNEFIGTVSIIRDITYEVEVDRLKSEFVATVSHELRTPMTSIRGYVDLLMMGAAGALSENQEHFMEIIKENTVRLNVLVNDLLDVSQIEAGKVALNIQPLDLREMSAKLLSEMRQRSEQEQKPIHFEMDAFSDLPPVAGDSERVRQILANLLENAFRYTPANGRVTVRLRPANDDYVQIDVVDTGIGIAPEEQPRVFERFYRGEHPFVLASAGTGLGLALVKQLVEMHKGEIWLKSVPGQGSTFSFTLPIFQQDE